MFGVSACIKTFVQSGLGCVYVVACVYIALKVAEEVTRKVGEWMQKRKKGGQKDVG